LQVCRMSNLQKAFLDQLHLQAYLECLGCIMHFFGV